VEDIAPGVCMSYRLFVDLWVSCGEDRRCMNHTDEKQFDPELSRG